MVFLSNRTKHILLAALLGGVAVLFLLAAPPPAAQAAPVSDARFGLTEAYEAPQAAFDSGASWELLTVRWDAIQPGGPSEWKASPELDEWIATARTAGREVVIELVGTPAWATDGRPGVGTPRGLYLSASDPANTWAAFVRQAVNYYGARGVTRFVIWEEPDKPASRPDNRWAGSIDDFYQLVKVAYQVGKGVNPNVIIHLGGVSDYDPAWFGRFLDVALDDVTAAANNYYFDVASVHIYYSPERVGALVSNAYYLMDVRGIPLKEVWVNRMNARPTDDTAAYPTGTQFTIHSRVTQEQQAAFIVQAFAMALDAGASRVAVHRLVDNLAQDNNDAQGLLRVDKTTRPAYQAYQLVTETFSDAVFARHVDDQTYPLIDYVRLTGASRVTHVVWARTQETATLVIPARSSEAELIDLQGNRWPVRPQAGNYRVVVGGAACDDPQEGCLIGGAPWILVERGVPDPLSSAPPAVTVERGGTLPTPDPSLALTATARAVPTSTPEPTETPSPEPSPTLEPSPTSPQATEPPPDTAEPSTEVAEVVPEPPAEQPEPALPVLDRSALRPRGFDAVLPYLLAGLGIGVIAGGVAFYVRGARPAPAAQGTQDAPEEDRPYADESPPDQPPDAQEDPPEDAGEGSDPPDG